MRATENYTPHVIVGLGMTVAILIALQFYLLREPGRISGVLAADKSQAVAAGGTLFLPIARPVLSFRAGPISPSPWLP